MSVMRSSWMMRLCQLPCGDDEGWLSARSLSIRMMFFGRRFSSRPYAGVDRRIMYGVRNVVMTETATTTG